MSDDRFGYLHLRPDVSLWTYVDEQVDWNVDNLEDRIDSSIWELIPPYQNEEDEGLLPSNSHPSYPFGNPYDLNKSTIHKPQLTKLINQPLASGSSLLNQSSHSNHHHHHHSDNLNNLPIWLELATDQLLWKSDDHHSITSNHHHHHVKSGLDDFNLDDSTEVPLDQQSNQDRHTQLPTPQNQTRTPTDDAQSLLNRRSNNEETEESDWGEEPRSGESSDLIDPTTQSIA